MTPAYSEFPVDAFPGHSPRLLTTATPDSLAGYLDNGGYAPLRNSAALFTEVGRSGLRGRGGAAFPIATKIASIRAAGIAPVLVANGEEGEPASVKDRWLMRTRPHLVLDGVRLAAGLIGAQDVYLYVSDDSAAQSLSQALAEFPAEGWNEIEVRVHRVDPGYVAGEETAAVRSINGGPALPQDKPPRPFESGVHDRPTMVSNVETLANLPFIHRYGADAYRRCGTADSTGSFLMTLSGTPRSGLYEIPFGVRLADVCDWLDIDRAEYRGALVGGYFAGVMNERVFDIPLEYGAFAAAGSGLGCGAFALLDQDTSPVGVSAAVLDYFDRVNAGQCGSCFNGTAAMAAVARGLVDHRAGPDDVERLRRWSSALRGRGACGTLDGAANVAAALLREFPHLVDRCLAEDLPDTGSSSIDNDPPFVVWPERHEVPA